MYFQHKLAVDNFAGGGGASTGIEWALGRPVDIADNHDLYALGMHRLNHPFTEHLQMDVFDVDPGRVTKGRTVGLAHFSPDCTHHSKAKGGKPVSKRIRGLCLVMLRWAKIRAEVMTMENVEEIKDWCPLITMWKNGKQGEYPDLRYKGRCWQAFLACLSTGIAHDHPDLPEFLTVLCGDEEKEPERAAAILAAKAKLKPALLKGYGYRYEVREIRGYSHGAPTIRNRLFMIARCDGKPIVWPQPTHGDPRKLRPGMEKWRTIAECLDFSLPCHSIFLTRKQAKLAGCKRPLVKNTLQRVATGVGRFVIHADEPFIVNVTNGKFDAAPSRVRGCDEPLPTQTGAQKFAAVKASTAPFITEHANGSSQRNMPADEPARTVCSEVKGGHFALVAANMVHTAHGERDRSGKKRGRGDRTVGEPMPTITASPDCALVASTLVQTGYGEREGQAPRAMDVKQPLGTVVAGACKHALAAASLIKLRGRNIGNAADEPMRTASAGGQHHGLVAATLAGMGGPTYGGKPTSVDRPMGTLTTENHTGLVAVHMAQHNGGNVGRGVHEPISTVTMEGSQQQLVATSLVRHFGESVGGEMDAPCPTVMPGGGGKTGLVAVSAAAYYGSEADGQAVDEPSRTVTAKARLGMVASRLAYDLTPAQLAGARRVAAFLRKYGVEFEGEFATVRGHVIVDIGMRMLTPRELFRAQGFGDDYVIDRAWVVDPKTGETREVKLTKEQQIRMCGNSVCPPVMEAIVRANVPDMIEPHPPKKWRPTLEVMKAAKIAA